MEQTSLRAGTEAALRVGAQAQFGSCSQAYMTDTGGDHPQGYCQVTCGRCNGGASNNNGGNNNSGNNNGGQQTGKGANGQTCPCTDTQPDSSASCQQQVRWLHAPRHTRGWPAYSAVHHLQHTAPE